MITTIKSLSYGNKKDRKFLQPCLTNWFSDPRELHYTDPRMSFPFTFTKWCSLSYKNNDTDTFSAMNGKWIVGVISLKRITENHHGHIFHLFVDKKYRRQGIGRKLTKHTLGFAKKKGFTKVTLNVVPKNKQALLLYKQMGFTEEGTTSTGRIKMVNGNL